MHSSSIPTLHPIFSYQVNQLKGQSSSHEQKWHSLRSAAFLKSTTDIKYSMSNATLRYTTHGFFFSFTGWGMHTIFMPNVFSASFPPILSAFLPSWPHCATSRLKTKQKTHPKNSPPPTYINFMWITPDISAVTEQAVASSLSLVWFFYLLSCKSPSTTCCEITVLLSFYLLFPPVTFEVLGIMCFVLFCFVFLNKSCLRVSHSEDIYQETSYALQCHVASLHLSFLLLLKPIFQFTPLKDFPGKYGRITRAEYFITEFS